MKTAAVIVTLSYFCFARLAQVSWSAAGAVATAKHVTTSRNRIEHRSAFIQAPKKSALSVCLIQ